MKIRADSISKNHNKFNSKYQHVYLPMEKEMATHSSSLAWRIPWMEEPGRLQSMGRKELDTA